MFGIPYNTVIVLLGAGLLGASAGLVGCFAVLRRRALVGDALAHAALPGVCLAFLLVGERNFPLLLLGAFLMGLLSIGIIASLRRWTRVKEDAAIGIVLSVFFGAGIVLLVHIQKVPGGNKSGLDSILFGQIARMTADDVYVMAGVALAAALLVLLLDKEFKIVSFDAGFAGVQGWPVFLLDLLLMGLMVIIVVIGLPVAGVVLMSALLIIPAVTARFWTDRLGTMLLLAVACGLAMGLAGPAITTHWAMPTGPVIVLTGAALFVLSLMAAPRRGLVGRVVGHLRFQWELDERKLLGVLYDLSERALPERPSLAYEDIRKQRSWSNKRLSRLLADLHQAGDVEVSGATYRLTEPGLQRAAEAARSARMWQLLLTEHPDLASTIANLATENVESLLPADIVEDLHAKLRQMGRMPLADSLPSPRTRGEGPGVRGTPTPETMQFKEAT